jgi:hypothetical protein
MSNYLSVRRVKIQTISATGEPEGPPSFGILASDDYEQSYTDIYVSLDELNRAIGECGSILEVVGGEFDGADRDAIGTNNYHGSYPRLES